MRKPVIQGIRGLMVDPARLIEQHDFYFELLPFMRRWGLNTLWWHFSDDQGFVLKLDGHPELATPHAFSKPEMRRFLAAAREHGVDVVPEVESLGHARYITRLPRYAHLHNGDPLHFNAACPSHPDTLRLLGEVIAEVAELFPSPYFHAGLDEVDLGDCRHCAARGRGRPPGWVYAQHVQAIHRAVTASGKRMILWADHVEKNAALLQMLPQDAILAHWQYTEIRPESIQRSLDAGFDIVCVPALCHWGDVVLPNRGNLDNMEAMVQTAASFTARRPLGVVNSWWTAWRGVRDAYLFAAAYTGRLLAEGPGVGRLRVAREFVADEFGLRDATGAEALLGLHDAWVTMDDLAAMLFDSWADVVELLSRAREPEYTRRLGVAAACVRQLSRLAPRVKRHRAEFDATLLAARIVEACLDHGPKMQEFHALCRQAEFLRDRDRSLAAALPLMRQATAILEALLARMDDLCREGGREWDRTRYADDPIKGFRRRGATACSREMLLGRMYRCRDYLKRQMTALKRRCRAGQMSTLFP